MTKITSPQSILVNGIPRHIKNLCPRHCVITLEEDSDSTTSSERRAESLLQDNGEDSEPDSAPTEEAEAGPPPSYLYEEVPDESPRCQTAIFVILRLGGGSERNHACGSSKRAQICLACKMRSGREKWVIGKIELTSSRS